MKRLAVVLRTVIVSAWAVPFIPILLYRAPAYFALMPIWYLVTSVRVLARARSAPTPAEPPTPLPA